MQGLKNQTQVKLNIVSCPPVTTVLIKRPDLKYQLGFSVQNGIVSLFILSILGMKMGLGKQHFLNRRGQPDILRCLVDKSWKRSHVSLPQKLGVLTNIQAFS